MARRETFTARRKQRRSFGTRPIEALERRQMLDRAAGRLLLAEAMAPRPDLDAVALDLVSHPHAATMSGLGDLAHALTEHPSFVRRHGLGTLLAWEVARHPYYAHRHGLAGMVAPAALPVTASTPVLTPGASTPLPAGAEPAASTTPSAPSAQPASSPPAAPDSIVPDDSDSSVSPPVNIPSDAFSLMTGCSGCQPTGDQVGGTPGNGTILTKSSPGAGGTSQGLKAAGDTSTALPYLGGGDLLPDDAGLVTGEMLKDQPVVPYTSQGGLKGFDPQYSSLQADAKPVIQFAITINNSPMWAAMTSIVVTLTLNGVSQGSVTFDSPGGVVSGSTYRFPMQADATGLSTGIYVAAISDVKHYADGSTHGGGGDTADFMVVNNASSPLGAGWTFGGVQALTVGVAGSSAMITQGMQGTEEYTSTDGVHYVGPRSDPSTLTHNTGGTWTRSYTDGSSVTFNSSGQETSESDRDGNTTSYAYVTSGAAAGAVATMTDPVGKVSTVAYDTGGHIQTITDPAGRVTTYALSSGDLRSVTDPDGAVTSFTYSGHKLVTEADPDGHVTTTTYDGFDRVSSEALAGGTGTTSIAAAEENGLVAAGGTVSALLPMGSYQGSVTDPAGHTTTVTFNSMGHPTQVTDPLGKVTTMVYNTSGWLTQVTDPDGRTTSYAYDSLENVTSVTRADGTSMQVAYGVNSQPSQVTDYRGLITTFTLNGTGDVTRRTDPDSNHEDYTYNSAGQTLTDTDRNGHTTSFAYDGSGNPSTVTEPNAGSGIATLSYGHDSAGDVTTATDELGHTTSMTYDPAGRMLSVADPVQVAAAVATSMAYDAAGNLTSVTDALGHVTSFVYDPRNRLTGIVDPANQGSSRRVTLTWGAYNLDSVTDANNHTTSFTYDLDNRPQAVTDADGDVTSVVYDDAGQVVGLTDANNHTTSIAYDQVGRVATVTYPGTAPNSSGTLVSITYGYTYNNDDQQTSVTDALGHTTSVTYDNLGRETAVTDALGHATSVGYDLAGNQTTVTDALGHVTSSVYDARNRLQSVTAPSGGGTTTYTYDQANRLASLTDADSNVTSWTYDNADRAVTETDPRGKATTTAYDVVGRVTQVTDRDNRVTQYGYDADNRETTEKWVSGGTTLRTITMTYDYGGRLTQVQDPDSKYAYTYDNADRLLTVDDNGTSSLPQVTLTYGYDPAGNRTSLDDSLGGRTSYTYDVRDELTTITQSGSGVASKRVDFAYDAAMRRTTLTRYADTTGTTTVLVTKYAYDAANRLTTLTHQTSGGTVRSQYVYTLDAANRLTSEARTWQNGGTQTDTVSYTYTNDNQLTGVTHTNGSFASESYSYDATGNRTMTGYSTTTGNRLASDGTYNYAYDDEGNMTTRTEIATGNQTLYTYDYRNRLTEVDTKPFGGSQTVLAQYTYDALNRRIMVVEGGTTTATLYDGQSAILDFNGSGTQTARYLQGPVIDEVLARETSGGTVAWYLVDREGTIRDIANNSGTIVAHVDYDSYGNVLYESSTTLGDRWKYTGREYDMVTGQYFDRARYYAPGIGRFTSNDQLGFASGYTNLYVYTANNPSDSIDPSGNHDIVFSGNNWTQEQEFRYFAMIRMIRARITTLTAEIKAAKKKMCSDDLELIGDQFDTLLDALNKMQIAMDSLKPLYVYHYTFDPYWFEIFEKGGDANAFVSQGNFWTNMNLNDGLKWMTDDYIFSVLFHEYSHIGGTVDWGLGLEDNPAHNAAFWGPMLKTNFVNSVMYMYIIEQIPKRRIQRCIDSIEIVPN